MAHTHCAHNLKFCGTCDVVWCGKCSKEWGNTHPHWNWTWTTPYSGTTTTGNDIGAADTNAVHAH
jgi:hypothetical protein